VASGKWLVFICFGCRTRSSINRPTLTLLRYATIADLDRGYCTRGFFTAVDLLLIRRRFESSENSVQYDPKICFFFSLFRRKLPSLSISASPFDSLPTAPQEMQNFSESSVKVHAAFAKVPQKFSCCCLRCNQAYYRVGLLNKQFLRSKLDIHLSESFAQKLCLVVLSTCWDLSGVTENVYISPEAQRQQIHTTKATDPPPSLSR
jgi:hypothetical protein